MDLLGDLFDGVADLAKGSPEEKPLREEVSMSQKRNVDADGKFNTKRNRDDLFDETNKTAADKVVENAGKFMIRIKDKMTPGFVKRYKTSKIFHMSVEEAEA